MKGNVTNRNACVMSGGLAKREIVEPNRLRTDTAAITDNTTSDISAMSSCVLSRAYIHSSAANRRQHAHISGVVNVSVAVKYRAMATAPCEWADSNGRRTTIVYTTQINAAA